MSSTITFRSPLRLEHLGGAEWKLLGDYLVAVGPILIRVPTGFRTDRAESDRIFRDLLAAAGVGRTRRTLMYWAVRVGGRTYWRATARG